MTDGIKNAVAAALVMGAWWALMLWVVLDRGSVM